MNKIWHHSAICNQVPAEKGSYPSSYIHATMIATIGDEILRQQLHQQCKSGQLNLWEEERWPKIWIACKWHHWGNHWLYSSQGDGWKVIEINQIAKAISTSHNFQHNELALMEVSVQWVPGLLTPDEKPIKLITSHRRTWHCFRQIISWSRMCVGFITLSHKQRNYPCNGTIPSHLF